MSQVNETQEPVQADQNVKKAHSGPLAARWLAVLGVLACGVLYAALPEKVTLGPAWLPLALEGVIILPIVLFWGMGHPLSHRATRRWSFVLLAVVTIALISGVVLLIVTLPDRKETQAVGLLRTGALLWISNIIVFALWYWEIDGGGPLKRHQRGHQAADFLFPQQADGNTQGWAPNFLDYLFLAFTAATALSPTDTYPLTRPAKVLMMIEAILALIVLAILVGRAVNIL